MSPDTLLLEGARSFELQADYFEGQIDVKTLRADCPHYGVLSANPLVLELERGAFAFVEKFGAVVFWNASPEVSRGLLEELGELPGLGGRVEHAHDTLLVTVGAEADQVAFNSVAVKALTLDRLKIISLALAQSVALEHLETGVALAMAQVHPVVEALRAKGRLVPPRREVLRIVGFCLLVRATVLQNLTLFDDPPETWESEALAHLDSALFDQFDLEERLKAIEKKLSYLQDAGSTFLGLLNTRKAALLEWIIIGLIAFEILMTIFKRP